MITKELTLTSDFQKSLLQISEIVRIKEHILIASKTLRRKEKNLKTEYFESLCLVVK